MTQKRSVIIFIDTNKTWSGYQYLRIAVELGAHISFLTFNPSFYTGSGQSDGNPMLSVDTHHDYTGLRVLCAAIHRDRPVDAVIGAMDLETVKAAEITAMLGMLFVGIYFYLRPSL